MVATHMTISLSINSSIDSSDVEYANSLVYGKPVQYTHDNTV